jgi:ribosomal-protein-alanine N-acetyltransferase
MNLHSIEANINPENIASRKLLEKTGFVREAYFKENYFFNGKFIDSEIYSLLNKNH